VSGDGWLLSEVRRGYFSSMPVGRTWRRSIDVTWG
jgi:hypothetical protein